MERVVRFVIETHVDGIEVNFAPEMLIVVTLVMLPHVSGSGAINGVFNRTRDLRFVRFDHWLGIGDETLPHDKMLIDVSVAMLPQEAGKLVKADEVIAILESFGAFVPVQLGNDVPA